mmetsp:Transcript_35094/g.100931  ORF Transcript_35094/g.100931 Transcript_35094/m.100931 type:complete len:86 (-) Transcript_35094:101-358(-)
MDGWMDGCMPACLPMQKHVLHVCEHITYLHDLPRHMCMYVYMSELECRVATTHKHETEKRREGERERGAPARTADLQAGRQAVSS